MYSHAYHRGDIYYVSIPHHVGCEMAKDRPAIIVSCDALNNTAPTVTVVYLSANLERNALPGHVAINSSRRPSVALCEQLFTVDKSRLMTFVGRATDDEMDGVDRALCNTLDLAPLVDLRAEPAEIVETRHPGVEEFVEGQEYEPELRVYKKLFYDLLDRMTSMTRTA